MTLEELKVEADKLGYRVVKKAVSQEGLLPCSCGCRRRHHRYVDSKIKLVCCRCRRGVYGYTLTDARRKWNRMIRSGVMYDTTTS